jgi:hypothetical protein
MILSENQPVEAAPKRPLSVRWIALGALLLVVGVMLGDRLIVAHVVEKNEELAKAYQAQEKKAARGQKLEGAEKAELRGKLLGNPVLVGGLAAMLLILPIGVGVAVGRLTSSKRDAAIAVAAGMAVGFAIEGTGVVPVLAGAAVYAGIGALAGIAGKRWASRHTSP